MSLKQIQIQDLDLNILHQFDKRWFLLTCGDFETGKFNTMTISWGSLGTVWDKPFAQVFVRPTRYTFEFMNNYDSFTLCGFEKSHKSALDLIGSKSGREGNKIADAGLTPSKAAYGEISHFQGSRAGVGMPKNVLAGPGPHPIPLSRTAA